MFPTPPLPHVLVAAAMSFWTYLPLRADEKPTIPKEIQEQVGHASQFSKQGRHDEAEKELTALLATQGATSQSSRAGILLIRGQLGDALAIQGKFPEAE